MFYLPFTFHLSTLCIFISWERFTHTYTQKLSLSLSSTSTSISMPFCCIHGPCGHNSDQCRFAKRVRLALAEEKLSAPGPASKHPGPSLEDETPAPKRAKDINKKEEEKKNEEEKEKETSQVAPKGNKALAKKAKRAQKQKEARARKRAETRAAKEAAKALTSVKKKNSIFTCYYFTVSFFFEMMWPKARTQDIPP
ncbi:hypothetical protein N7481_006144 [Penicillium waksmanii]|uniref:uncharacterized protein n=1 Tax=Penicillium waksmanii TaxID=69791 RepID=UPI00254931D1|nr:uncharacterized protein N7481_006144 [Penicillium waksmanii]KAJ5984045.1 hypothetical protein N7481_006144 [Penicillium waksmanii]